MLSIAALRGRFALRGPGNPEAETRQDFKKGVRQAILFV